MLQHKCGTLRVLLASWQRPGLSAGSRAELERQLDAQVSDPWMNAPSRTRTPRAQRRIAERRARFCSQLDWIALPQTPHSPVVA